MQQKKNPLLIVLGVCGGCVLLAVIAGVIIFATFMHKGKGLVNGTMNMMYNPPKFLGDLKNKNYAGASALIDPSVREDYTADKIQELEDNAEKKLGPLQSYTSQFTSQNQTQHMDPSKPGQMPSVDYIYTFTLTYKKGTATATFNFENKDILNPTGLITGFKIEPDEAKKPD